jgi:hypothetical protein
MSGQIISNSLLVCVKLFIIFRNKYNLIDKNIPTYTGRELQFEIFILEPNLRFLTYSI